MKPTILLKPAFEKLLGPKMVAYMAALDPFAEAAVYRFVYNEAKKVWASDYSTNTLTAIEYERLRGEELYGITFYYDNEEIGSYSSSLLNKV